MRSFWGAACVALCASASSAFAADLSPVSMADRFYVSFHGGSVFSSTSHDVAVDTDPSTGSCAPLACPTITSDGISKPGFIVGAAIGTRVGNAFRLEGEINYASSSIDHINVLSPIAGTLPAQGSGSSLTGMINGYVDFHAGRFTPYVGAGIGLASFTAHGINVGLPSPPSPYIDGTDTGWAYQLMAGVDFQASEGNSIGARYRYMKINDITIMDGGYRHDFDVESQSVELVFTHRFGS
jgi:opacity protein-like surface antigen